MKNFVWGMSTGESKFDRVSKMSKASSGHSDNCVRMVASELKLMIFSYIPKYKQFHNTFLLNWFEKSFNKNKRITKMFDFEATNDRHQFQWKFRKRLIHDKSSLCKSSSWLVELKTFFFGPLLMAFHNSGLINLWPYAQRYTQWTRLKCRLQKHFHIKYLFIDVVYTFLSLFFTETKTK